ncbi:hypothetical protein BD413DRAFT_470117 [Trametes elegans]|nr:hypothetical protein BD413DRAFT_470117 [Trametes elegans]
MYSLFPAPIDPTLPEFQSLLVKGPYHASAPVHLLLSHSAVHPEAKAILLTPCRSTIQHALVDMNDEWLDRKSGHGRVGAASRRTEVFYPPTLAHLRLLLSMLHEYDGVLHHAKTTLDVAPSLLVLHELSAYFDVQAAETTCVIRPGLGTNTLRVDSDDLQSIRVPFGGILRAVFICILVSQMVRTCLHGLVEKVLNASQRDTIQARGLRLWLGGPEAAHPAPAIIQRRARRDRAVQKHGVGAAGAILRVASRRADR